MIRQIKPVLLMLLIACYLSCAGSNNKLKDCLSCGDQASEQHKNDTLCSPDNGGDVLTFGDLSDFDPEIEDFANKFQKILMSHWNPPSKKELKNYKGWTAVCFCIARDGTINDIGISHYSGCSGFDKVAVEAVRASSKSLPLPKQFKKDCLRGLCRFYYNMSYGKTGIKEKLRETLR